jgi:hypothetical protein
MFAAKKVCGARKGMTLSLQISGFQIEIFDRIDAVEERWSVVSAAHDIFYGADFLRCIENFPPSGITPYYGLVSRNGQACGIVYMQHVYVKLGKHLRKPGGHYKGVAGSLISTAQHLVIDAVNFNMVVCGNLMLTGRYGYYFNDKVAFSKQAELVSSTLSSLQEILSGKSISPGLVLIKDFFERDIPIQGEKPLGFTKFSVQPKMILEIQRQWKNFDDYLEDIKSKYRVRARKALSLAAGIEKRILEVDEIAAHREEIHRLYRNVADQAAFNAFILHDQYFENLKAALGKQMTFTTYWQSGKMVAFFTSIRNYDVLDAHFLGYDPKTNADAQLYLNMLYDLIKEGITMRARIVDMSRTAIEIKSTVGAVPHPMYLFLKHSTPVLNQVVKFVIGFVKPNENFIIRQPFRDAQP